MPRARSVHLFAGAGGDTIAAEMADVEPVLCGNHWTRAVETHASNFPHVEHVIGDLSVADPKRFPRGMANVLMASPECVYHSTARNYREALRELKPYDPHTAAERSRCTMFCPQRWADWHRFDVIIMENVVDVVRWKQFPSWVKEWAGLGYKLRAVYANSAFFGAPQSRDRVYFVAWRNEIPDPDLEFRPPAWCWACCRTVEAVQSWKESAVRRAGPLGPAGKYGPRAQYLYRCPACREVCSPYARPAWTAIDWSLPAERIGDRDVPLRDGTLARIRRGLAKFGYLPHLVPLDRTSDPDSKRGRPMWLPAATLTGRQDVGFAVPDGMQIDLRGLNAPRDFEQPVSTLAAGGNHHGLLTTPPVMEGEGFAVANYNPGHVRDVTLEPIGTLTAGGQFGASQQALLKVPAEALITSYYRSDTGHSTDDPMGTVTAIDRHALVQPPRRPVQVEDCSFRMIEPHECQAVMDMQWRYRRDADGTVRRIPYQLTGPKRDRVRMSGNGVTPSVEAVILDRCLIAQGVGETAPLAA